MFGFYNSIMALNATAPLFNSSEAGAFNNDTNASIQGTDGLVVEQSIDFRIMKIVFYCIILLGSSLGNSLVIYIIASNARMRTPSNILILNLAVCDFITPLLSIPFDFVLEEYNYTWIYGAATCKILWPLTTMTSTSAGLTLAAISLDRYRVIMHPFKSRLTMVKIKFIIAAIYVFSLLMVAPYSYMLSLEGQDCRENWPDKSHKKYYTLVLFMVQYFLPLSFMVVMYTLALKNLYTTSDKASAGKTQKEKTVLNNNKKVSDAASPEPGKLKKVSSTVRLVRKLSSTMRRGTNEANKRATKMFIAIVVVFTICMFPNQALWLWRDFSNSSDSATFQKAVIICWLFTYSNSVCNPVIYAFFSRDFRRGFKRVLRQVFCIRRHKLRNAGLNASLVATLTTELKGAATAMEQRKRKTAVVTRPKIYIL